FVDHRFLSRSAVAKSWPKRLALGSLEKARGAVGVSYDRDEFPAEFTCLAQVVESQRGVRREDDRVFPCSHQRCSSSWLWLCLSRSSNTSSRPRRYSSESGSRCP